MEMRLPLMLAVLLGALCTVVSSLALPHGDLTDNVQMDSSEGQDLDDNRRAIWLETRELDEAFKEMVYSALVELEKEGRITKGVVAEEETTKSKRGRWQGFCFRRTRSGRYLPYICWKGDRK